MRPEKHHARVLENADPEKLGRVIPEAKTVAEGALLRDDWVAVLSPFAGRGDGFYYPPPVGALLELEVEADSERGTEDLDARGVGYRFTAEDPIPAEFAGDATNRGGVKFGEEVLLQDRLKKLSALISANVRLGFEDASHPLIRGDTFNAQLEAYLTAEEALATENAYQFGELASVCTAPPLSPLEAKFTALQTAWTTYGSAVSTFKGALSTWLSTRCKTE